ncbi:MAG: tetratricopeptide repeat protein [Planctomycetota bacterium]|jgi:tetratricopeptide (TPR) repeat protein
MRGIGAVLTLGVLAHAQEWRVPAPNGAELLMVLQQSKRTYTLGPHTELWKDAPGPERITTSARSAFQRCRTHIEAGRYGEAEQAVRKMLARNPADWDAHYLRALALHRQKKKPEALAALRESLIGNRRRPEAWQLLGEILGRDVRPRFTMRAWMRKRRKDVEIAYQEKDQDADFPWIYYGIARAWYRYEGGYRRAFGRGRYRFTFREQLFALGAALDGARSARRDGDKVPADLKRLRELQRKKTLVPFVFFALYPEPVPAKAEPGFERLKPQLERYFDTHICKKR